MSNKAGVPTGEEKQEKNMWPPLLVLSVASAGARSLLGNKLTHLKGSCNSKTQVAQCNVTLPRLQAFLGR